MKPMLSENGMVPAKLWAKLAYFGLQAVALAHVAVAQLTLRVVADAGQVVAVVQEDAMLHDVGAGAGIGEAGFAVVEHGGHFQRVAGGQGPGQAVKANVHGTVVKHKRGGRLAQGQAVHIGHRGGAPPDGFQAGFEGLLVAKRLHPVGLESGFAAGRAAPAALAQVGAAGFQAHVGVVVLVEIVAKRAVVAGVLAQHAPLAAGLSNGFGAGTGQFAVEAAEQVVGGPGIELALAAVGGGAVVEQVVEAVTLVIIQPSGQRQALAGAEVVVEAHGAVVGVALE